MSCKQALICGIGGQDGAFLARFLLEQGYQVTGTSRDAATSSFNNLKRLDIYDRVTLTSMAVNDFRSVLGTLTACEPNEIYNLAGQSSVGLSFEQPVETIESISGGTLNILEAIRFAGLPVRFYNAGSSECFGNIGDAAANERTPFRPRSPYGIAKSSAFYLVNNYRESYGLFASSGILFNHESYLRPDRFVTQKIVRTAAKIAGGSGEKLRLGNIDIKRDWGWAPEYVEVMWRILQMQQPDDFVIATGRSESLASFVARAFDYFALDWREHVAFDSNLHRPLDIAVSRADPTKAREVLGWQARVSFEEVVERMCRYAAQHPS